MTYREYFNPRISARDRENLLELYSETSFYKRYRFSKDGFVRLLNVLELERQPARGNPLPPVIQLAVFLHYTVTAPSNR